MDPAIGSVWNAVEFARTRTLDLIKEMSPEQLGQRPGQFRNSIAALITHVAATEVSFAHRFSGTEVPGDLKAEFLMDRQQPTLPQPEGETAESLTARLQKSGNLLKPVLEQLNGADLDRVITRPNGTQTTIRLMTTILSVHGMLHYGHMQMIKQHLA